MAVKSNPLFQIPEWIENDRTVSKIRSYTRVRPNARPNASPINNFNTRFSPTATEKVNVNLRNRHHDHGDSKPPTFCKETLKSSRSSNKIHTHDHPSTRSNNSSAIAFAKRITNCASHKVKRETNTRPNSGKGLFQCGPDRLQSTSWQEQRQSPNNVTRHTQLATDVEETEDDLGSDGGILFINHQSTGNDVRQGTPLGRISPSSLMQCSGASSHDLVFEVDLHAQGLEKIENLDQFTKLRTLDLSCNAISRVENLQHNKELRELKLYDNSIDEITGLEKLGDLCHLQLQHNRISKIGNAFCNQKKLQILRIDSNCLKVIEARELASLSALVSLDISSNQLQDISSINALPMLEELNASHNRLETVADIGRCKRLKEVNVSSNQLRDVSGLCGMHSLMVLSMSDNLLTNTRLKSLGKLHFLQYLNVSGNKLTTLAMIPGQFSSLEVLHANRNKLEDFDKVNCLQKCPSLTELFLEGNPVCLDKDDYQRFRKGLANHCDTLEMLDGVYIKKAMGTSGHAPIMRPMTATSAVSTRQVENQLKLVEDTLSSFQTNLTSSFADIRSSMSHLTAEVAKKNENAPVPNQSLRSATPWSPTPSSSRPASRCGSRQRIAEAQAFASTHF